jgi:hypothetical protein
MKMNVHFNLLHKRTLILSDGVALGQQTFHNVGLLQLLGRQDLLIAHQKLGDVGEGKDTPD